MNEMRCAFRHHHSSYVYQSKLNELGHDNTSPNELTSKYTADMLGQDVKWSWMERCPMSELMREPAKNILPQVITVIALQEWPSDNMGAIGRRNFDYLFMGTHGDPFTSEHAKGLQPIVGDTPNLANIAPNLVHWSVRHNNNVEVS